MKNKDKWKTSKYVYRNGVLTASSEVAVCSRLFASITASFYDENIKTHCSGKLLDLGCGNVPLYEAYRNSIDDVICADWSNTFHKNQYLDCECDLTQALPFQDGEFDTLICSDVLEHLPNPELLWSEMNRILKKGGKVLISVPFFYWIHEAPYDYHRYTNFALEHFAKQSGFEVLLLESMGGWPEVAADGLAKFLHFRPFFGSFLALLVQKSTAYFISTKVGKRVSNNSNHIFPLGYFLVVQKPL